MAVFLPERDCSFKTSQGQDAGLPACRPVTSHAGEGVASGIGSSWKASRLRHFPSPHDLRLSLLFLGQRGHAKRLEACSSFLGGMAQSGPVDGRHPTLPVRVVVYHSLHSQLIRLTMIVRIIAVEGED